MQEEAVSFEFYDDYGTGDYVVALALFLIPAAIAAFLWIRRRRRT